MKCRICGQNELDIIATKLRGGEKENVYYCKQCDYGMLEKSFFSSEDFYDKEYRKKFKNNLEADEESPKELYEAQKDYQDDRVRLMGKFFEKDKNLLEIGCSSGQFLSRVLKSYNTVTGIELSKRCAQFTEENFGVKVYTDDISKVKWEDRDKFDQICFFQVLEHVDDPIRFLENVYEHLNEGGYVFIEVPNLYDPLLALWEVPYYEQFYYHQAHLSYFTEISIKKIMQIVGFKVIQITYLQDYNFLNHVFWYFNNEPQSTGKFGLDKINIKFKNKGIGSELNNLFNETNREYIEILKKNKMTSNMFVIGRKQ